MNGSLLISGGIVWTGGVEKPTRADVLIEGGMIAAIVPPGSARADETLDASTALVAPGFVNAHVHPGASPMLRGIAEDADVAAGAAFYHSTTPVRKVGFEVLSADQLSAIIRWDTVAMLIGGATTIVNEQFGPADHWLGLVDELGFRSSVGTTYPGDVGAIGYLRDGVVVKDAAPGIEDQFADAIALHERYDGAHDGRLRVHLSVHGTDTVPEDLLRETARVSQERAMSVHLHLAQHEDELNTVHERYGIGPVELLDRVGLLTHRLLATHGTYLTDDELARMARRRSVLVHCSYRKAKEGHFSPFVEYLRHGGPVALATDSFDHDLVQDMRLAALLGKIRAGSVGAVSATDLFTCVTAGASKALPWSHLGRLVPGGAADLVVIALDDAFGWPSLDPLRTVVYYARGGVRHSVVDGRTIVRDGTVADLDLPALAHEVEAAARLVWGAAAERGLLASAGPETVSPPETDEAGS